MDINTIKEIIRIQLLDLDIIANETHYEYAIKYYIENNGLPDVNYLILLEAAENENEENNAENNNNSDDNSSDSDDNSSDSDDNSSDTNDSATEILQHVLQNSNELDVKKVIKDINDIKLLMYKDNTTKSNTECFICYDSFVDTDLIRILPCSHIHHRICIDDHLTKISYLCPYCQVPAGEYIHSNL